MQLGSIVLSAIGLYCQWLRYRQLSPVERQQLKWVLLAVGLLLGGLLTSIVSNMIVPSLDGAAFVAISLLALVVQYALYLGLPLAFAFSMLRYRLWDADIVINRTLVYAASTFILSVMFFGLFFALKAGLGALAGVDSTLPLVISTAMIAALFNPVRARLARFVDKQIYGFRIELKDIRNRPVHETHFVALKNISVGQHNGKQVGGYRLLGLLGKGGMGEVYAADAPDESGLVAVKILPPELATQTEPLARFELEAKLLGRLNHPHIVRTMGAGTTDGLHYLVMELIDGQTLSERIKQTPPMSRPVALGIIRDIAAALDTAHAAGIVHRDIKPSNILLRSTTEGVEAVLTDFGIAKLVQDATTSLTQSNLVGTLDYIAPEQIIASREVDHRADIYALGVIAYQLLVGQHPFGGSPAALLFAHLNQPAPDPREVQPDFSRSLSQALLKALAKKPDERYGSASDFARALENQGAVIPV
jgi:serine/threonine-protein kinase